MTLVQQINEIVEQMPERKQGILFELVQTMLSPDDTLSEKDINDIKQARAEFARGEYVLHEDIDWS
ncbi:MAG: hypothetical protein LBE35_02720 [Clostridiales bacterium]|jgi:hypothetical protein|nr:hypothetical protein [Clostridiales bacterium]